MENPLTTVDKLRKAIQNKPFLSGKELVELGLVESQSTLSLWRLQGKGPPCIHLSSGKNLYPADELLEWVQACYLPRKNATQASNPQSTLEASSEKAGAK